MSSTPITALVEAAWDAIYNCLDNERRKIHEEIKNYPRLIPACDVQFNDLLEQRAHIGHELERMHETRSKSLQSCDVKANLESFLRACRFVDGPSKLRILMTLNE